MSEEFLITPDLSDAIDTDAAVTPGIYNLRVVKFEMKKSQAGQQYIKWTCEIFGAEGEFSRFNKWKVYHNTMTSGKAAGMLKSFYKACKGEELTGSFNPGALLGSEIQAQLAAGTNQDGSPSKFPVLKNPKGLTPF